MEPLVTPALSAGNSGSEPVANTAPEVAPVDAAPAVAPAEPVAPDTAALADAALEPPKLDTVAEPAPKAPEAPVAATPPAQPEPASIPQWGTVREISESLNGGKLPPHVVPYVRAALDTMRPLEGRVQAQEAEYSAAKEKFLAAAAQMESQGAQGAKGMAENYGKAIDNLESLTSEHVDLSIKMFEQAHPEYKQYPDSHPVKVYLGKMWSDGTADRVFTGSYYDKIEQAYKFALFQTGTTAPPAPSAAATVPAARPQNTEASRQALVHDGAVGTQRAPRVIDDVSLDEILSQNDYLLGK